MGPNIRAGAHYTQFMVYDFDGDGRAEMAVKTAPGTRMTRYAPDGTVLPCQSWLREGAGLGNILHDPWHKIWNAPACRRVREESAKMEHICQLGTTVPAQGGL